MALINTNVTTSTANVYASSGNSVVSVAYFCNNTEGSSVTFNLWAVPAGDSADDVNQIYQNVQIAEGDTFVVDMEKLVLGDDDSLQANASGNVAATISYVGI